MYLKPHVEIRSEPDIVGNKRNFLDSFFDGAGDDRVRNDFRTSGIHRIEYR